MASFDAELLSAARHLLVRNSRQRGKLPRARIRRSVSTSYYALFHFLLGEIGTNVVGTRNELTVRKRLVARSVAHGSAKSVLDRVRAQPLDSVLASYFGHAAVPPFAKSFARVFADTMSKRHRADYDLNESFSEADARTLASRASRVIDGWRAARLPSDRDFKQALCLLILLKGQLRSD